MDARQLVDYAASLDCIHCGLCLNTCPTYRLTGVESSSPRGRIHLMRAVAEAEIEADAAFAEEMDFCLLCRHCESVCPSGVRFGAMMEHTRSGLEKARPRGPLARMLRWLAFRVVLPHRFAIRIAARIARCGQMLGLAQRIASAPRVPPAHERRLLPARTAATGERAGSALMLEGCVMPELYGRVNRATATVLARAGFDVHVPHGHACCGSLHAHNGDLDGARTLARATIEAFEALDATSPIVVNSAGCSAHMKEYAHLFEASPEWKVRAERFAARVVDLSQFLASPAASAGIARALADAQPASDSSLVTYDDPCHLCHGQGIRKPPRELLDRLPGLRRVEMPDSEACCGSAGIYSLTRPADSQAVLEPKLASLAQSGATMLVTANPGCQMQWESGVARAGLDVRVVHLAELLERATKPAAS